MNFWENDEALGGGNQFWSKDTVADAPPARSLDENAALFSDITVVGSTLQGEDRTRFDEMLRNSSEPDEDRARSAVTSYFSQRYGKPTGEIAQFFEQYSRDFSRTQLNEFADLSPSALYGRIGAELKRDVEEREMLKESFQGLYEAALAGEGNYLNAWNAQAEARKGNPGFRPERMDAYRSLAKQAFNDFAPRILALRPEIDAVAAYLSSASPRKGEQTFAAARDALMGLSDAEIEEVIGMASVLGKKSAEEGEQKGGTEKAAGRFLGAAGDIVQNAAGFFDQRLTETPGSQSAEQGDKFRRVGYLLRNAQRGTGKLKSDNWLAEGVLASVESLPYMAASLTPAGIAVNLAANTQDMEQRFQDRGLTPEQSKKLAGAAAAPYTALDFVSAKMAFAGKLPGFEKLITAPVTTAGGVAARGLGVGALQFAEQYAQEVAQDLTAPAAQSIASFLDGAIPDVDWSKEFTNLKDAAPETMAAVLPLVLLGTGVATFKDASYGSEYLKRTEFAEALGFSKKLSAEIAAAPTAEAASEIIRSNWDSRAVTQTPTQQQAVATLNEEAAAVQESNLTVEKLDDGTFAILDADGQQIDTAQTQEAAAELLQDHQRAEEASLDQTMSEMRSYVEGFQEPGQSIEVVKGKQTLAGQVKENLINKFDAQKAIKVAVELGKLEAGATLENTGVIGENIASFDLKERIFKDVSRIYEGAAPETIIEEHAEGYLKRRLADGSVTLPQIYKWREAVEGSGGFNTSERAAIEWFSQQAQAYLLGKQMDPRVPKSFRAYLRKLKEYFAELMKAAANLVKMEREGTLPEDFRVNLAQAVGLDRRYLENQQAITEPRAPAVFKAVQSGFGVAPDIELFNATQRIGETPPGSTVSRKTIEDAGFKLPPIAKPSTEEKTFALASRKQAEAIERAYKERRVTQRIANAEGPAASYGPEISALLKDVQYEVIGPIAERNRIMKMIEGKTNAEIERMFFDATGDIKLITRIGLGQVLSELYAKEKNFDKAAEIVERTAELGTEAGQGINMFKLLGAMLDSPEKALAYFARQRNNAKKVVRDNREVDAATEEIEKELEAGSPDRKRIESLKKKMEDLTTLLNEGTTEEIAEAMTARRAEVSKEVAELQAIIADARKALKGELKNKLDEHEVKLAELRRKIDENVRILNEGTSEEIAARLGKDKQKILPPEDIAEMKRVLADSRKALEAEIKAPTDFEERVIKRMRARGLDTPKQVRDAIKKIVELKDEGKLPTRKISDIIASKYEIPDMSTEERQELANMAERVARLPQNSVYRADAVMEMMNFMHDRLKNLSLFDMGWALWYGNILSGYNTHIRNVVGNAVELGATGFIDTLIRNPAEWYGQVTQALYGSKRGAAAGFAEGYRHFKTGESVVGRGEGDKFSAGGVLERVNFTGGRINPANYVKYVGRLLRAEDSVAFHTAYELKSFQGALEMAQAEGLEGEAAEKRVQQLLNLSDEQQKEFTERAESEWANLNPGDVKGTKAEFVDRRVLELTKQEREDGLVERATDYANRVTFNYKPEGLLGILAEGIATLTRGAEGPQPGQRKADRTALETILAFPRLIVPFARVVANVTNRQLDYLIGAPRSILPSTFILEAGRIKFQDKTADQRAIELKKGLVGAAGLIAAGIAGMPGDDDEERGWSLHAGGPSNPNARAVLAQTGWKPWSLQIGDTYIPFRYLPIGIGLASVAEMHDHARYKETSDETAVEKVGFGLAAVGAATLDASFLSNLSDFLGAVSQRDGDARAQALNRFVQRTINAGSLVPFSNLVNNLTTDLDAYDRDRNGAYAFLASQVPVSQLRGEPAIDLFGDAIENRAFESFVGRSKAEGPEDRLYRLIAEKEAWPTGIRQYQGKMEPDAYYEFQKVRGAILKQIILRNESTLRNAKAGDDAKDLVQKWSASATKQARQVVGYVEPK